MGKPHHQSRCEGESGARRRCREGRRATAKAEAARLVLREESAEDAASVVAECRRCEHPLVQRSAVAVPCVGSQLCCASPCATDARQHPSSTPHSSSRQLQPKRTRQDDASAEAQRRWESVHHCPTRHRCQTQRTRSCPMVATDDDADSLCGVREKLAEIVQALLLLLERTRSIQRRRPQLQMRRPANRVASSVEQPPSRERLLRLPSSRRHRWKRVPCAQRTQKGASENIPQSRTHFDA